MTDGQEAVAAVASGLLGADRSPELPLEYRVPDTLDLQPMYSRPAFRAQTEQVEPDVPARERSDEPGWTGRAGRELVGENRAVPVVDEWQFRRLMAAARVESEGARVRLTLRPMLQEQPRQLAQGSRFPPERRFATPLRHSFRVLRVQRKVVQEPRAIQLAGWARAKGRATATRVEPVPASMPPGKARPPRPDDRSLRDQTLLGRARRHHDARLRRSGTRIRSGECRTKPTDLSELSRPLHQPSWSASSSPAPLIRATGRE